MDAQLAISLNAITKTHQLNEDWAILLPQIITRIKQCAITDPHSKKQDPILFELIQQKRDSITRKLDRSFTSSPPFTLVRLAELLEDPEATGYPLTSIQHILKFFNALSRLVCVSSNIDEFPPTTFLAKQPQQTEPKIIKMLKSDTDVPSDKPLPSLPANIHVNMVEIPWLKNGQNSPTLSTTEEGTASADESSAPTAMEESPSAPELSSPKLTSISSPLSVRSPVRRRRTEEDEEATKRPRTNTSDDDKMDISSSALDDGDNMDISTENILEESDRSEVCTPG
ncbi:hypothetical protein CLIB1423_04S07074 [[Candida] railenensis]|uniref:Uncharacterized protein n=1 Tax=[Candida] railenensis TaxID=45579 RepID=A0A9P0QN73_9ASCO|nr:hypothetical protein CLIB1423_04S07074 [[Candida] railenensis]